MDRTLLILENTVFFKKGQVLDEYELVEGGVNCQDKFISENHFVEINENMDHEEEEKVRKVVREQLQEIMFKLHKIK